MIEDFQSLAADNARIEVLARFEALISDSPDQMLQKSHKASKFHDEWLCTFNRKVDVNKRTVTTQSKRSGHNMSSSLFSFSFIGHILA